MTDAAVHDSRVVNDILDPDNTASDVWADTMSVSPVNPVRFQGCV